MYCTVVLRFYSTSYHTSHLTPVQCVIQGLRLLAIIVAIIAANQTYDILYRTNAVQKWEFDRIRICSWMVLERSCALCRATTERHVHVELATQFQPQIKH